MKLTLLAGWIALATCALIALFPAPQPSVHSAAQLKKQALEMTFRGGALPGSPAAKDLEAAQ